MKCTAFTGCDEVAVASFTVKINGAEQEFGACEFHTDVLEERFEDDIQMVGFRRL